MVQGATFAGTLTFLDGLRLSQEDALVVVSGADEHLPVSSLTHDAVLRAHDEAVFREEE